MHCRAWHGVIVASWCGAFARARRRASRSGCCGRRSLLITLHRTGFTGELWLVARVAACHIERARPISSCDMNGAQFDPVGTASGSLPIKLQSPRGKAGKACEASSAQHRFGSHELSGTALRPVRTETSHLIFRNRIKEPILILIGPGPHRRLGLVGCPPSNRL